MKMANSDATLKTLSDAKPVLLVFLRHFGCSFCREALADIARLRPKFEASGLDLVMVHMAPDKLTAEKFFKRYRLSPVHHVSDPEKRFYRSFGLGRGTPAQLFGLQNWIRGFQAAAIEGHGFAHHSEEIGDGFQMPGIFVVHKSEIKNAYIHRNAWDRPNYEEIVGCCNL